MDNVTDSITYITDNITGITADNVTDDAVGIRHRGGLSDWAIIGRSTEFQLAVTMWKTWSPVIVALGTLGNVATLFVMHRIKDNSSQYVLLMVLAVSDLCLLHSLPLLGWLRTRFGFRLEHEHNALCKLLTLSPYAFNSLSAWLVTAVTLQRTLAVLWPHRMRVWCTAGRSWILVVLIVGLACAMHGHVIFGFSLHATLGCYPFPASYEDFFYDVWHWVDTCISSLLPFACLLVCDVILSWTLFQSLSVSSQAGQTTKTARANQSRRTTALKTTVMILALSCTFFILTSPVCGYYLWFYYGYVYTPQNYVRKSMVYTVTSFLWYTNSAVNFPLYCLTGSRFRQEFLSWFRCRGLSDRLRTAMSLGRGGAN